MFYDTANPIHLGRIFYYMEAPYSNTRVRDWGLVKSLYKTYKNITFVLFILLVFTKIYIGNCKFKA